eukprot:317850-Prorocentrum_minimum.AAC.1
MVSVSAAGMPGNSLAQSAFAVQGAGGSGEDQEPGVLDLSEFPSLGGGAGRGGAPGGGAGLHGIGSGSAAEMIGQVRYYRYHSYYYRQISRIGMRSDGRAKRATEESPAAAEAIGSAQSRRRGGAAGVPAEALAGVPGVPAEA